MVVIINGEIVADSDPRAKAMRRTGAAPAAGASQAPRQPRGGIASLHGPGSGAAAQAPAGGLGGLTGGLPGGLGDMPTDGPDGVLTPISRALGVEGRVVTTPAVLGVPEQRFPMVVLILSAAVGLFAGPRFGAGFFVLYTLYTQQAREPAAPPPGQPAQRSNNNNARPPPR